MSWLRQSDRDSGSHETFSGRDFSVGRRFRSVGASHLTWSLSNREVGCGVVVL